MLRPRLSKVLTLVFASAACGLVDSGQPFPYVAATNDCGPADGPAVSIYLAAVPFQNLKPPTPYIHLIVWQPVERLAGRSWSVSAGEAVALRVESEETVTWATNGSVTIEAVGDDGSVHGSADLWFPSGTHLALAYNAVWVPSVLFCG